MPGSNSDNEFGDEVQSSCLVSRLHWLMRLKRDFIVDIDTIQAHGIGAADITKLKANGFHTVAVRDHTNQLRYCTFDKD